MLPRQAQCQMCTLLDARPHAVETNYEVQAAFYSNATRIAPPRQTHWSQRPNFSIRRGARPGE
eukprot:10363950-Alexandrium_andersonii.AAC.1